MSIAFGVALLMSAILGAPPAAEEKAPAPWRVGTPIVTYWAGPPMSDAVAEQMAAGGWNLVWCGEKDLDLIERHGLRGQLGDPLISAATLDDPAAREKLDALIARVRTHPALYSYFIIDEPNAAQFPALGRLVAHLRERDPAHMAYINLFPTYASNEQLGTKGDVVTAYTEHLNQFVDKVKPALISYDHYQFTATGDSPQYFLNLSLIRRTAQRAGVPFLNIVQACTWTPSMRIPTPDEMRYLVHTTVAYGAQGISYYVYSCVGHTGGIVAADGTPTPIYHALKVLNRDFVRIAGELQPLRSLAVFHAGVSLPGTEPLPKDAVLALDPPQPAGGALIGLFGPAAGEGGNAAEPTHAVIVQLDHKKEAVLGVKGPANLDVFDPAAREWTARGPGRIDLRLPPGGGCLVRFRR